MRVGEFVPIYKSMLPIPLRLRMAFGLYEGSELHVAPIIDDKSGVRFGCEIIVSPVPFESWRSVCRLSVRLQDTPRALAVATGFLRDAGINILLTECCSTYQERAHWDAICDLGTSPYYSRLTGVNRNEFEDVMLDVTEDLTTEFKKFMDLHPSAFLKGVRKPIEFSPLTGLNDAAFLCDKNSAGGIPNHSGAVAIPRKIADQVSDYFSLEPPRLPDNAIITGNTEQRYMRVLFLQNFRQSFRMLVNNNLEGYAGGGVGVLHQLLASLPEEVNLVKVSNYMIEKDESVERGRIELMGNWRAPRGTPPEAPTETEKRLRSLVDGLALEDIAGNRHAKPLRVTQFTRPDAVYAHVFVSYSTKADDAKLEMLIDALLAKQFHPVLGTGFGHRETQATVGSHPVTTDVIHTAFPAIDECVAFISLQVKREDFHIPAAPGTSENDKDLPDRYLVSPWAIAEEVYAWSANIGLIIRLKDKMIEDPRYNQNTPSKFFTSDEDYPKAVQEVVAELENFRLSPRYDEVRANVRRAQFEAVLRF